MIHNRRDPAGSPGPAARAEAEPTSADLEQASDAALIELVSQSSVPAFAALVDRTIEAARAELATVLGSRSAQILASTYVEVWWLAGCHRTPGTGATDWVAGIVRRRTDEAFRGMTQQDVDADPPGPRPSYSELEMAALLGRSVGDLLGV
jgi:hypothetical protein